jgi:hypothetical protein
VAALAALPSEARAADHLDSPAPKMEPTADITDVFSWMDKDAKKLNLVMNVSPFAGPTAAFSNAVQYVLHVASSQGYGMPQTQTDIQCQFYAKNQIECWVGGEYVWGEANNPAGLVSTSGKLRVFAGLRDDPFFFELVGFQETVKIVTGAAPSLVFDAQGCPAVNTATSAVLVKQLQSGKGGVPASDTFKGANVLSLVVQIDKTVVNSGGPTLGVWASTHAAK